MTVLAVLPGKALERMELKNSLESMQKFVGGTIQAVYPFPDPVAVVCNDDGKLMGLEHNRALRDEDGNVYDILCGPFFVCGLGEENFASAGRTDPEIYPDVPAPGAILESGKSTGGGSVLKSLPLGFTLTGRGKQPQNRAIKAVYVILGRPT